MLETRIGPTSPLVSLRGNFAHGTKLVLAVAVVTAACGLVGGEITVTARNDSDVPMVVQVVDADGAPHGPAHRLEPLEEREVELALPGATWTIDVNGARVFGSVEAQGRTGRLPITLILPAPDDPVQAPRWEDAYRLLTGRCYHRGPSHHRPMHVRGGSV